MELRRVVNESPLEESRSSEREDFSLAEFWRLSLTGLLLIREKTLDPLVGECKRPFFLLQFGRIVVVV